MNISLSFIKPLINFCGFHYREFYLLIAIVALAFVLRIYDLSGESYWSDEFISLRYAQGDLESIFSTTRPRLHLFFAHIWIKLFGDTEYATRLLSVFFGTASVLLTFSIGKSLFGKTVGLIGSFLMAVSQFQIYYSQEFRYYSLFLFMSLVSFFFYIRVIKTKSNIYTVLYAASTILLYYTQDFAIFVIGAQNLFVIINYKSFRPLIPKWFLSQIVVMLCILPGVIANFMNRVLGSDGPDWLKTPDVKTPIWTIYYYFGSGFDYPPIEVIIIAILCFLTGIIVHISYIGKQTWVKTTINLVQSLKLTKKINSEIVLLGVWILFPILMVLILSEMIKPMYHHRYLIFVSPALCIAIALILTKIKKIIPISVVLITYVILIIPGLSHYYSLPVKEQWKSLAAYISENEEPGDLILYINQDNYNNFLWYYTGNSIHCVPNMDDFSDDDQLSILDDCTEEFDRIWLFVRKELSQSGKESLLALINHPYTFVREKEFAIRLESNNIPRIYYVGRLTLYLLHNVSK